MPRRLLRSLMVIVLTAFCLSRPLLAFDEIKLSDLPAAVKAAVAKKFPKGKLATAEKEEEEGVTLYQVSLTNNKKDIEIALHENGEIVWTAIDFPVDKLPKAIKDAIHKAHPKAKITSASEIFVPKDGKDLLAHYEVEISTNNKIERVLDVLPNGEIELDELSE